MSETHSLDAAALRRWIDRTETAQDVVTGRLIQAFRATLDDDADLPAPGEPAPLGVHWCLAPPIVQQSGLGPDGHAGRGGFLPPVSLPRRMWAGGRLELLDPLRVGDEVARQSRVVDVTIKHGRSGMLCFVAVDHEFSTARGPAIRERHDIVYREAATGPAAAPPLTEEAAPPATWSRAMRTDPVQLFRYSALTFNGHRIHYDRSYASGVEFYPGLIVHGPLQATLMMRLAAELRGRAPRRLLFRGRSPLVDTAPFSVNARESADGLDLWVATEAGIRTMTARAAW